MTPLSFISDDYKEPWDYDVTSDQPIYTCEIYQPECVFTM